MRALIGQSAMMVYCAGKLKKIARRLKYSIKVIECVHCHKTNKKKTTINHAVNEVEKM